MSWNSVVVKLPICLSLCPSVWLGVKLNYVSGHRADCAKATWNCTHTHTNTETHTHTQSLGFADRRAWRVGNEKRSSCMKAHVSKLASRSHTHTQTHTHVQRWENMSVTLLITFITLILSLCSTLLSPAVTFGVFLSLPELAKMPVKLSRALSSSINPPPRIVFQLGNHVKAQQHPQNVNRLPFKNKIVETELDGAHLAMLNNG